MRFHFYVAFDGEMQKFYGDHYGNGCQIRFFCASTTRTLRSLDIKRNRLIGYFTDCFPLSD